MINTERLSSDEELQAMLELFYNKIEQREKEWDIKVLNFIKDNLKSVQLFYDPYHPTNFFFKFVVDEILKMLNISERRIEIERVIPLDHDEIPIYGYVKCFLGLEYTQQSMRKRSNNVLYGYSLDVKEYIIQYLLWAHGVNYRL